MVDTNVLVSGLYYPASPPGRVLDAVAFGRLTPVFDRRILAEYVEVFARPKFRAFFRADTGDQLLMTFVRVGLTASEIDHCSKPLRDEGDRPFIEVVLATGVPIITGNLRDFGSDLGVVAMPPADVLRRLGL